MAHSDWVPRREQDFVDLCERWRVELADGSKVIGYDWDPAVCNQTLQKITAFTTARQEYELDKSQKKRIIKDEEKSDAIDLMRDFANNFVRFNKKMRDEDKIALGLHPKDTTPTHQGTPVSHPTAEVDNTHGHFEHKVRALFEGELSKPHDAYGVRYAWQVGGQKPGFGGDLPKSKFSRKPTMVITHTELDKAKTAYYAVCYENSRGDTGPWSVVVEAVIA